MIPNIEATIELVKKTGLEVCADYDEDCQAVYDHAYCQAYISDTGVCPFLCAVRNPMEWGGRHLGHDAFRALCDGDKHD